MRGVAAITERISSKAHGGGGGAGRGGPAAPGMLRAGSCAHSRPPGPRPLDHSWEMNVAYSEGKALGGVSSRVLTPVPSSRLLLLAGRRRGGRERSRATGRSRPFAAPHPLTAELRRSQLPHLFIYQSVMSAEDAFEALLVISLAGKEILHISVFYSF